MSTKIDYIDKRISKSKRALKNAILSLMQTKEFKEITISEIVKYADLNRGTFYKHYDYKEDLLNEIIDEVIEDLIDSYREPYKGVEVLEIHTLSTSTVKIFEHVKKYETFYTLIVQTSTLLNFQHKFCSVIKELALNDINVTRPNPQINRELHANYQAYAILGLIIEWINGGFKYSTTYMSEQLIQILKHNQINSVVKPVK